MRRFLTFALFAVTGLAIFAGCQKSETTTTKYYMRVDVGSKEVHFGNCFVNLSYNPLGANNYVLEGVQDSADFPTVFIGMPTNVTAGVYNIGSSSTPFYAKYFSDTVTTHVASSGILVISATSPAVIGTFSFTCTDGTVLSKAVFVSKPPTTL